MKKWYWNRSKVFGMRVLCLEPIQNNNICRNTPLETSHCSPPPQPLLSDLGK
jgi:hypothetical protein